MRISLGNRSPFVVMADHKLELSNFIEFRF